MKYKNGGPVTVYVVIDSKGQVQHVHTNLKIAHAEASAESEYDGDQLFTVLTYDQRGAK